MLSGHNYIELYRAQWNSLILRPYSLSSYVIRSFPALPILPDSLIPLCRIQDIYLVGLFPYRRHKKLLELTRAIRAIRIIFTVLVDINPVAFLARV